MEWQADQDRRCDGCGFPRAESTDRARRQLYDAHIEICWACAARDAKKAAHAKETKGSGPGGAYFPITERTVADEEVSGDG